MTPETPSTPPVSPVAQGSWLSYTFRDSANVKALLAQRSDLQQTLNLAQGQYKAFYDYLGDLPTLGQDGAAEIRLLEFAGCTLFEPRAGQRVTEREIQSGRRPFVGTKVGGIFVGTSLGSKSHSQSVSYQLPEELKEIDTGSVIVTTRQMSFVGALYTRSIKFTNLVSWHGEGTRMSIATSNRQSLSIFQFTEAAQLWVCAVLADAAEHLAQRRLDTSGKDSVEALRKQLADVIAAQERELDRAFTETYAELEKVNAQLRFYYGKYPTRVQDPGPVQHFQPLPRYSVPTQ